MLYDDENENKGLSSSENPENDRFETSTDPVNEAGESGGEAGQGFQMTGADTPESRTGWESGNGWYQQPVSGNGYQQSQGSQGSGYQSQTSQTSGSGYQSQTSQTSGSGYQSQTSQANGNGYQSQTSQANGNGYQSQASQTNGNGYQGQIPQANGNGYQSQASQTNGNGYQGQTFQGNGYQNQTSQGNGWNQQQASGNGYQQSQGFQGNGNNWSQQNQNGGAGSQNGYNGYQQAQTVKADHKKKKDKKPSVFRKAMGITAAALLFGVISGGTMVGVNMLADSMEEETTAAATVQASQPVTLSDEEIDKIITNLDLKSGNGASVMDVSEIVKQAMPSVVAINNTVVYQMSNPWFGGNRTYESVGSGSGIIVGQNDSELLIVTNNHVVENASELTVTFIDETAVGATVKGTDSESDLAIVSIPLKDIPADTMSEISIAELGSSDDLEVGQGVVAIGNALGYGQSVTVGYVSALNREVKTEGNVTRHLLQTDAAINPGNSGGALLNMKGQVIGINAAKYTDTDVEGMGYAIPISQAESIIDTLMVRRSGEKVEEGKEGYLGIRGLTVDESMVQQYDMPAGVYVYQILENGAASKTDLREKDVITKFDGQSVRTMASLQDLLQYYKAGEQVELVVESLENGQYVERTITITLEAQDQSAAQQ